MGVQLGAGADERRSAPTVNATGLRTALRWCGLGAELRHLADTCLMPRQANHDPKRTYTTGRYQKGGLCRSTHKCGILQSHILSFELLVQAHVSFLHSSPGRVRAAVVYCYPGGNQ